jgi:hypothetical protein
MTDFALPIWDGTGWIDGMPGLPGGGGGGTIDFTATPTAPTSTTVNVAATVDPPATSHDWAWGDGETSNTSGPNTSHTYGVPGTYTITLTAGGMSVSHEVTVGSQVPPDEQGTWTTASVEPGEFAPWKGVVTYSLAAGAPANPLIALVIDDDDANRLRYAGSPAQGAVLDFVEAGVHKIEVNVFDATADPTGQVYLDTATVYFESPGLAADEQYGTFDWINPGGPWVAGIGIVDPAALGSTSSDWDWGDGSAHHMTGSGASGTRIFHTYAGPGPYPFVGVGWELNSFLQAWDGSGWNGGNYNEITQHVSGPVTPTETASDPAAFSPSDHTVVEVKAYLDEHPDQVEAVLAAEAAGKARSRIANYRPHDDDNQE